MTRHYRPVPQPEPDPGETWGPIAALGMLAVLILLAACGG